MRVFLILGLPSAILVYPGCTAYCASKFGLRGFSEALRRELARTDTRVLSFSTARHEYDAQP
ncbi:MAG: SDR family NAD(P)-dependent oxidoreductase [Cellvibrionales bacterium]|nr:SDR family NAD(P)-dependent oxidoreductase [Cellvibrionales bacterium]